MQTFQIELNLAETNAVLGALANLPYGQVADLIAKIKAQAERQLTKQDEQ